ncbi:uncharacterized protein LOC125179572 [Hyalella azteca]|uniref:Uncharacterized protein LOC125179572 n=1 Tax=Hyalella azteca TaxID=294128 RepID=A0A979FWL0_HYAAZ|nr:uncharacterized protein LOC125179572 [Hyalella azteca]
MAGTNGGLSKEDLIATYRTITRQMLDCAAPPPIASEEASLPCPHRTALSQLRSGYCSSLEYYTLIQGRTLPQQHLPGKRGPPPVRPARLYLPLLHTSLSVSLLWDSPEEAAAFLATISVSAFAHLPPLPVPLPRPPPEPPLLLA